MKNIFKLLRRFVGILLLSSFLLLLLNFFLLVAFTLEQAPNGSPWKTAEEAAAALTQDEAGQYTLSEEMTEELAAAGVWAIFIDDVTKEVVWHTENLPDSIPASYSLSDIAGLTRGYIDGYPTFTGQREQGLLVLGYPKDSFWKHMWPSWDYNTIAHLPQTVLLVLGINVLLIFCIYTFANSRLFTSIRPIVSGIQSLANGEAVFIREKGLLSELAASLNKTSEILQSQKIALRRKETARANWIAGVSHDIRTPLSMVMGYADQLKTSAGLSMEDQKKASVIVRQSARMKDLINDLNLASKLEYNMQPLHPAKENLVAVVRQVVVDFLNLDPDEKHPILWETDDSLTTCPIYGDKALLARAVSNLIQNSINHNPNGCSIHVAVKYKKESESCSIQISDDGCGVTAEQLDALSNAPHYMVCDENTTEQRHGLGLLIVKQIAAAHGGSVSISRGSYGGFSVEIFLPLDQQTNPTIR